MTRPGTVPTTWTNFPSKDRHGDIQVQRRTQANAAASAPSNTEADFQVALAGSALPPPPTQQQLFRMEMWLRQHNLAMNRQQQAVSAFPPYSESSEFDSAESMPSVPSAFYLGWPPAWSDYRHGDCASGIMMPPFTAFAPQSRMDAWSAFGAMTGPALQSYYNNPPPMVMPPVHSAAEFGHPTPHSSTPGPGVPLPLAVNTSLFSKSSEPLQVSESDFKLDSEVHPPFQLHREPKPAASCPSSIYLCGPPAFGSWSQLQLDVDASNSTFTLSACDPPSAPPAIDESTGSSDEYPSFSLAPRTSYGAQTRPGSSPSEYRDSDM